MYLQILNEYLLEIVKQWSAKAIYPYVEVNMILQRIKKVMVLL